MALLLAAVPVGAQPGGRGLGLTRADSLARVAAARDSSRVLVVPPSGPRLAAGPPRQGYFDAPRWVMLRTLVVPGWGQLHNGSWLKALIFAGGEGLLVTRLLNDARELDALDRTAAEARAAGDDAAELQAITAYNDRVNGYVGRQWLLAGMVTYGLLDAYVDAHFRNFKLEFEHDPALPGDYRPAGTRLGVGWRF